MSEHAGRGSAWSTTFPGTCACSRPCSRRTATTSSRPRTASAALELAASAKPDLVLLDVMMPPPDGYAVCTRLREQEETAVLPVIMLTASEGSEKTNGDRGRRGRLHPEAVQPRRAAHAHPVAAPDQALPRHDQGSGSRVAGSEPDARGARADAARGARATAAAATVPLAPARGRDRLLGRRVDPAQPPPAGRDVLRRPARLDELRRRGRAGGADARARGVPRHDRRSRRGGSTRRSAFIEGDGVQLFFNDPIEVPDAALRAVRLGLRAPGGDGRADGRSGRSAGTTSTSAPASRSATRPAARSASRAARTTRRSER